MPAGQAYCQRRKKNATQNKASRVLVRGGTVPFQVKSSFIVGWKN
jgi:hypothetical protein